MFIWIIKNVKRHLPITLGTDCVRINDDFLSNNISFDDGFLCTNGQHPRLLRLLIQKRASQQTALCLTTFYRLVRIGVKKLPRKLYGLKSHLRLPD
jgi:hypothetical protein